MSTEVCIIQLLILFGFKVGLGFGHSSFQNFAEASHFTPLANQNNDFPFVFYLYCRLILPRPVQTQIIYRGGSMVQSPQLLISTYSHLKLILLGIVIASGKEISSWLVQATWVGRIESRATTIRSQSI